MQTRLPLLELRSLAVVPAKEAMVVQVVPLGEVQRDDWGDSGRVER